MTGEDNVESACSSSPPGPHGGTAGPVGADGRPNPVLGGADRCPRRSRAAGATTPNATRTSEFGRRTAAGQLRLWRAPRSEQVCVEGVTGKAMSSAIHQREGDAMVDIKSGPIELVRGVIEAVFGKGKQFIGTILGRDDLINEGEAQEDKAEARRNAGKKEAAAGKASGKAKAADW